MKVEREKILELVYASINVINEALQDNKINLELKEDTPLFGNKSNLDSLGLVTLIVEIEQRLAEELSVELSLTDEKAMSQKRSPFRDVRSLVDYICGLT